MKKRTLAVVFCFIMAFSLVLTACSGGDPGTTEPPGTAGGADSSGGSGSTGGGGSDSPGGSGRPGPDYLQLDITGPELYEDSVFGYAWESSAEVYKVHVYSRLLWLDGAGNVTGGDLASDYSVSADALTYTATLRDGLKWHDGVPLTVNDVVWGVKATLRDAVAGPLFKNAFGCIVGASAFSDKSTDDLPGLTVSGNTITFKLEKPSSVFLYVLGQWPLLPEHLFTDADPNDLHGHYPFWSQPVGCGPYMFTEVVKDEYAIMSIYPDYHGPKPGIERIYMALTGVAAETLVPNDNIDFFATQDPSVISYMENYQNYTRYDVPVNYVRYLMCNTVGKGGGSAGTAVSDFRVRKALLHALDLESMLENFYGDMARQTNSKMSNMESPYHNPNNQTLKYDPDLAKRLLDEAGYDYNYDFVIGYYYNDQLSTDFVDTMVYYWEAVGIKAKAVLFTGDLANMFYFTRDYDVLYAGLGFVLPEDTFGQFLDSSIMTQTLGSNPKWQELYDNLSSADSQEARFRACFALQDFEQTMLVQLPLFNLDIVYYVNEARVSVPTQYFSELRVAYNRHMEEWVLFD